VEVKENVGCAVEQESRAARQAAKMLLPGMPAKMFTDLIRAWA
jgi:hypothetical protein